MQTAEHHQLEDTSESESDGQGDNRITAYSSDDDHNNDNNNDDNNEDELQETNIELEQVHNVVTTAVNAYADAQETLNDENIDDDDVNLTETQNDTTNNNNNNNINERQKLRNNNNNNGSSLYNGLDSNNAFRLSMLRIFDLLKLSTTSFLFYISLTLNAFFFFIGALSSTRNLGKLWFRVDYDEEFEYSFGWYKSHELEGDWTPVSYKDLDSYFDTNIEASGGFFGTVTIIGLILLIILALIQACRQANIINTAHARFTSNVASGIMLGISFIFFIIYVISILDFHSEFEDVCGQLVDILDSAHNFYHSNDLDFYECADDWAMYLQYANTLFYVLSMILFYEVRKGGIALQIAEQAKLYQNVMS